MNDEAALYFIAKKYRKGRAIMDLPRWIERIRCALRRYPSRRPRRLDDELCPAFQVMQLEARRVLDASGALGMSPLAMSDSGGDSPMFGFGQTPGSELSIDAGNGANDGQAGLYHVFAKAMICK